MNIVHRFIPPVTLIAHAWTGHYEIRGKASEADCVIGFSFGYRGKRNAVQPGLSNNDLANILRKHDAQLPKILQFEIANAYDEQGNGKKDPSIMRIAKHRRKGQYLDTREVAVQAQELMRRNGFKKALLLAHPYHLPRIQAVCSHLGIDWVTDDSERGAVEFDPLSSQKWTQNVDRWRGYEPLATMFYRLKGWL